MDLQAKIDALTEELRIANHALGNKEFAIGLQRDVIANLKIKNAQLKCECERLEALAADFIPEVA